MPRDAEDIIVFKLGQLMVENAALTAQVEALTEQLQQASGQLITLAGRIADQEAENKRLTEERG